MKIYEAVRKYIEQQGLKQGFVAERAGITKPAMSMIMTGRRKMYAEDLKAICRALGVSPEEFFCNNPAPPTGEG